MDKKLSEILAESSLEETNLLIDKNTNFELDNETKKRIEKKVVNKIKAQKSKRLFLINKRSFIAACIGLVLVCCAAIVYMGIFYNNGEGEIQLINNTNAKTPNVTITPSQSETTKVVTNTPIFTHTPTQTHTATPYRTPTPVPTPSANPNPTPVVPKEGVEVTWPDSTWIPASAKAYMATYPGSVDVFEFRENQSVIAANPVEDIFRRGILDFSYKSSYKLMAKNKENFNYSPLSVYYALAVLATGAEGETYDEFMKVLELENQTKEFLSKQSGNLYRRLYLDSYGNKFKIANSLWLSNNFKFKEGFIQNAVNNYYASVFNVDFSDLDTATLIRKWIFECTDGTMSPKIDIDKTTLFKIINTLYFTGHWREKFDPLDNTIDRFYPYNTSEVSCEFMKKTELESVYFKGEDYSSTAIDLIKGSMVFVLPDEGVSIEEFLTSGEKLETALNSPSFKAPEGYDGYSVTTKLPKFGIKSSIDLIETLQELGLMNAFTQAADFSGLTDMEAIVSQIHQDSYIEIDENGVKAGAFTDISGGWGSPIWYEVDFTLNRPFIYAIMYEDIPVFIGACMNPIVK